MRKLIIVLCLWLRVKLTWSYTKRSFPKTSVFLDTNISISPDDSSVKTAHWKDVGGQFVSLPNPRGIKTVVHRSLKAIAVWQGEKQDGKSCKIWTNGHDPGSFSWVAHKQVFQQFLLTIGPIPWKLEENFLWADKSPVCYSWRGHPCLLLYFTQQLNFSVV